MSQNIFFRKILAFIAVTVAIISLSSCLKDSDQSEITYYEDTAVTGFSLGTLNRYLHTTKADGKTDSIYKTTYNAKSYAFNIDQTKRLIYNVDSLPYGTDAKKMVCSVSAKNSGVIALVLKDKNRKDSLAYYNSADSLDLSSPLRVRIFNMRGTSYRDYTVTVNIHKEQGTEFSWSHTTVAVLASVGDRKMVGCGKELYLFGVQEGKTYVYRRNGKTFEKLAASFGPEAYRNVVAMGDKLYLLDGGKIFSSADGGTWKSLAPATPNPLARLIGAGTQTLFAMTAKGIVASQDKGATWTAETLDAESSMLPDTDINLICMPTATNSDVERLILVGTRDGKTRVWNKVNDLGSATQQQPWSFYPEDEYNVHTLPALANLWVVSYDGGLLATGGDLSQFYMSNDQGVTWIPNTTYTLPASFGSSTAPAAMATDSEHYLYIMCQGDGELWSARLARTAWVNK